MKCLIVLAFIGAHFANVNSRFCYWNTGCAYRFFSSRTSYDAVRGDIRDEVGNMQGCEPISIWGIYRHGKRYPGKNFGVQMKEMLNIKIHIHSSYVKGNCSLCAQDVDNLLNWPVDNTMFEKVHHLSEEGYQEMLDIASRLEQAYPQLLTNLEEGSYKFRPAYGYWIEKGGKGFIEGLKQKNLILDKVTAKSDIMAPYATCGKYERDVKLGANTYREAIKYHNNPEYFACWYSRYYTTGFSIYMMKNLKCFGPTFCDETVRNIDASKNQLIKILYDVAKDRIHRRTGINYTLTNENIIALYDLCRYTWSDSRGSPWCSLFTTEDLKVFEYESDLRHYYRNSYGTPLNEKFGSIPMADLLKEFQLAKDGRGKKIIAYFTHATMMDMIYTALGLFKDEHPLTGAHRDIQRKWRTSKLTNFSANLIAALNRCTKDDSTTDYNVAFYLNEKALLSICNEGVCTWQEFEDILKPFSNTTIDFCEFETDV